MKNTLGSRFGFCVMSERIQASRCVGDTPLAVLTGLVEPNPVTRSGKNKHGGRYLSQTHYELFNLGALEVSFVGCAPQPIGAILRPEGQPII